MPRAPAKRGPTPGRPGPTSGKPGPTPAKPGPTAAKRGPTPYRSKVPPRPVLPLDMESNLGLWKCNVPATSITLPSASFFTDSPPPEKFYKPTEEIYQLAAAMVAKYGMHMPSPISNCKKWGRKEFWIFFQSAVKYYDRKAKALFPLHKTYLEGLCDQEPVRTETRGREYDLYETAVVEMLFTMSMMRSGEMSDDDNHAWLMKKVEAEGWVACDGKKHDGTPLVFRKDKTGKMIPYSLEESVKILNEEMERRAKVEAEAQAEAGKPRMSQ